MSKVHEMLLANAPKSMEEKYFSEVNLEFFLSPFKKKKKSGSEICSDNP